MVEPIKLHPTPDVKNELPEKVGKYEIRALLGEGGTGVVYEGFDPDIERRVAIKILHPHLIKGQVGEELLARFKREAISAAKCIHTNIVTILEYGRDDGKPYIVMEYVDGISVQRLIKMGQTISLKMIFSIISQLLRALNSAHRMNIIHRDVKAANVLILKKSGRIKLADFGMARITERPDLTMVGQFIGTPRYMAPELRLGFEADCRADIFSSARLLLELLKLMPDNLNIPRSRLPEMENMPPGNRIDDAAVYPDALIPVLIKGLEVDRANRYQSAREFVKAIKEALPRMHQKADPAAALPASRDPVWDAPASDDELDSMTKLLADYLGPIATIVMEEHETKSTTGYNLVTEISKEIPEADQRDEFLRRWARMSLFRRSAIEKKNLEIPVGKAKFQKSRNRSLPTEVLKKIGIDLAHYIGPIAEPLLKHYSSKTEDVDQLVKSLGKEIPDLKEGQKFVKSWLHS
ncbi:MAG: serine/threonine-protein kinase [Pseudomonadota bacterium]